MEGGAQEHDSSVPVEQGTVQGAQSQTSSSSPMKVESTSDGAVVSREGSAERDSDELMEITSPTKEEESEKVEEEESVKQENEHMSAATDEEGKSKQDEEVDCPVEKTEEIQRAVEDETATGMGEEGESEEVVEFNEVPVGEATKAECAAVYTATKFHCDFCGCDLSREVRIRDVEVKEYDLCVNCFSAGVERGEHKKGHRYRVVEPVNFPVLCPEWTAIEELLLLEGIEIYGPGNWPHISEHVGTKTAEEAHNHYKDVYLSGPRAPLPEPKNIQTLKAERESLLKRGAPEPTEDADKQQKKKKKKDDVGEGTPQETRSLIKQKLKQTDGEIAAQNPVGYMPLRGDFEVEYDNEHELIIMNLELFPPLKGRKEGMIPLEKDKDTELEREMKLDLLEIYHDTLVEREKRRKFVLEHLLLNTRRIAAQEKKRGKHEKDVRAKWAWCRRFQTRQEHEDFVTGILHEEKLRRRIREVHSWREAGIRSLKLGEAFETERKRREKEWRLKEKPDTQSGPVQKPSFLLPQAILEAVISKDPANNPFGSLDLPPEAGRWDSNMLLSPNLSPIEVNVMKDNGLTVDQYLTIKRRFIQEAIRFGGLAFSQAQSVARSMVNEALDIKRLAKQMGIPLAETAHGPGQGLENLDSILNVYDFLRGNALVPSVQGTSKSTS